MAAATRGDDFAATAANWTSCLRLLCASPPIDSLCLRCCGLVGGRARPKGQDRVAASFDSPNGLRGLRNVEGFVKPAIVGDKQIKNRAASAARDRRGQPPPRREEKAVAVTKTTDTSPESVAPTLKARAWLGTRPEATHAVRRDRPPSTPTGACRSRGASSGSTSTSSRRGMRKRDSGNKARHRGRGRPAVTIQHPCIRTGTSARIYVRILSVLYTECRPRSVGPRGTCLSRQPPALRRRSDTTQDAFLVGCVPRLIILLFSHARGRESSSRPKSKVRALSTFARAMPPNPEAFAGS